MGSRKDGYDWDWVNGYQVDSDGNLFDYGDQAINGYNTGIYIKQSTTHAKSGQFSAEFHIGVSSGAQHCKLFEINQDRYPESYWSNPQPEAYYSAWYWFPADFADTFIPRQWNNRLIMQWADRGGGPSNFPTVALLFEGYHSSGYALRLTNDNWWRDGSPGVTMWETGYTAHNIPKGQWVHVVVYVKMASGYRVVDGKAIVWINGEKVVDADVALWNYFSPNNKGVCWGIGNYGTAGSPSSIWIDNVQVTG